MDGETSIPGRRPAISCARQDTLLAFPTLAFPTLAFPVSARSTRAAVNLVLLTRMCAQPRTPDHHLTHLWFQESVHAGQPRQQIQWAAPESARAEPKRACCQIQRLHQTTDFLENDRIGDRIVFPARSREAR